MISVLREREKEDKIKGRKRDGGRGGTISWAQESVSVIQELRRLGQRVMNSRPVLQTDTRAGEKGMKKEEMLMVGKEKKH